MAARRSYGTGSLYPSKDGRNWVGHWRANGRQIKRTIGPKRADGSRDGLTRKQAEVRLRELMSTPFTAARAVGQRVTVETACERYRQHLKRAGRKRSHLAFVECTFRVHVIPFFAGKSLDAIRHEDVADFVANLERKGLAPKTIRNYANTLSALFNYAMGPQRRWASANPCVGVELPGVPDTDEIRFLDEAEWEAVLRHVQPGPYEQIDRALYLTALMAGLRHGELCALRWRDVDWVAGRVRVRQNWVLDEFDTPKSRRGARSVPMADRLAGELDRLHKAAGDPSDDALVFPDPMTGAPLDKGTTLYRYRKALKAAALDPAHNLHGLRHTFGTRMAAAGVPMRTLQEWMGHRDIKTTQRYADYAPSPHESALMERAWSAPDGRNDLAEGEDAVRGDHGSGRGGLP
jgi:integrase